MEPALHTWAEIVTSSVVPVVIISACGLLCLAFYNRLAVVVTRLRSLQRERLAEYKQLFHLEEKKGGKLLRQETEQFLHFLEGQTAEVFKRAYYLRNCIFSLILCIFSLVVTSLMIGLSLFYPTLDVFVLIFFVIGLGLLLMGLSFAIFEIKIALNPVKIESGFVQKLIQTQLKQGRPE